MSELLEIRGLNVTFAGRRGTVAAVQDLDLDLASGEILGLVGESGAGKSSVGNALMGLIDPPGRVEVKSFRYKGRAHDWSDETSVAALRGGQIGMIFQDPLTSLDPLFTVGDQLTETMAVHTGMNARDARAQAIGLLRRMGIDDAQNRVKHYPHQFSGGMRQRVVIALALCCNPDLVIADEPTTALDVSVQAQILDLIRDICRERRVGVILVTHNMGVIAEVTDRVAVMYRGKVVESGPTADILARPQHPYTQSLVAAVPRSNLKLARFPRVEYRPEGAPEAQTDTVPPSLWLRQPAHGAAPAVSLVIERLRKEFVTRKGILGAGARRFTAVDDVSFEVRPGEVMGLVGESGSGKSTIAHMVVGLLRPTSGSIVMRGIDDSASGAVHSRPQMVFQDPYSSLNPRMRVGDIISEPLRFHRLVGSNDEAKRVAADLLMQVGLSAADARRYPHEFSGGQRQRISIARALATRPRFLVCDEPTSALDVSIQAQILNLLKDLQEQLGLTMLFISHDLPVVRQMCDRVAVLRHGKLMELAATEDLFDRPRHPYTQELLRLMPRLDGIVEAPAAVTS